MSPYADGAPARAGREPSPDAARLREARDRLMRELGAIAAAVDAGSAARCPYRDADDRCTFRGRCRNRRTTAAAPAARCSGEVLTPWRHGTAGP